MTDVNDLLENWKRGVHVELGPIRGEVAMAEWSYYSSTGQVDRQTYEVALTDANTDPLYLIRCILGVGLKAFTTTMGSKYGLTDVQLNDLEEQVFSHYGLR